MNRKSILSAIASVAVVLSLSACSNSSEKESAGQAKELSKASLPSDLKFNNDMVNAIYPWYLELQEALVVEDMSAARKAAFAIEEGSRQLDGGPNLTRIASEMVAASDIARQRELFQDMTAILIDEVKSSGLQSGEVFIATCPMAFDNQGADWISGSKEIRNPYYGDQMLTCGSVKETI